MSDQYLWDRSGRPDPEIERLERTLAPLGLPDRSQWGRPPGMPSFPVRMAPARAPWWRLPVAASVILAAAALSRFALPSAQPEPWQISRLEGSARLGGRDAALQMPVRGGQTLRTGGASELTMEDGQLGEVDLGPDSEMRAASDRRMLLRRGTLHAYIWAPPREFVVDTPSARAVDLGCEYTVTVHENGDGLLRVSYGWVAFQFAGRESFIPAGAECVTHGRRGPGIPYYGDAPPPLRDALARFERGEPEALAAILDSARPRDGLTLWHLLTRASPAARGAVFDRFAQLVPLPPEATREGALSGDARTIDLCWNALDLEKTEWWRGWERRW